MLVLAFAIFGLPEAWRAHREKLPTAITVEIMPIGKTNIKPSTAHKPKKTPKTKAKKQKKPKPKTYTKKQTPPKKSAIAPPKKVKQQTKTVKKPPSKQTKTDAKKKPKELDFNAILKSVAEAAQTQSAEDAKSAKAPAADNKHAKSDIYNPDLPLAMSEIDAIRQQFVQCWNIPAGAKNAHDLSVILNVRLAKTGEVISVELAKNQGRYYNDPFFRAAADSAMRAVRRCSPLRNLPWHKYESWKFLEINFDPHDLLF